MSLINTPPQQDRTAQTVNRLLSAPNQIFTTLLAQWQQGVKAIWNSPNPQAILDGLGTNGPALFQYSVDVVEFLESQVPGCTASTIALIQPTTIVNGCIVITLPPSV